MRWVPVIHLSNNCVDAISAWPTNIRPMLLSEMYYLLSNETALVDMITWTELCSRLETFTAPSAAIFASAALAQFNTRSARFWNGAASPSITSR